MARAAGVIRAAARLVVAFIGLVVFLAVGFGPDAARAGSLLDEVPAVSRSWTVPAGVSEIRITAEGASGATQTPTGGGLGGSGATASGVFAVSPGDVVRYVVGEQPPTGSSGFEGGGGGSTGVFINGTLAVVAGGGGGYDNTQTGSAVNFGQAGTSGGTSVAQGGTCANGGVFRAANGGTGGNGGDGGDTNNDNGPGLCTSVTGGGGGGGVNGPGEQGYNGAGGGGGGADMNPLDGLAVAAGGAPATSNPLYVSSARGGRGFTGGGGGVLRAGGGGGGYSGGAGANSGVWPGGGGSFVAPSSQLTTTAAGSRNANAGNGSVSIQWSTVTLQKVVINDNGHTDTPADFTLRLTSTGGEYDGTQAFVSGAVIGIDSNGGSNQITLGEDARPGYRVTANTCAPLTHTAANIGTDYTCAITNDDLAILAVDDTLPSVNGGSGGATVSVLGNDTLGGTPVTTATVILTPGTAPAPAAGSITMNPDGTITIAPGTTAGTYSYPYQICDRTAPTVCDTAVATVVVTAPVIDAVDDTTAPVNGLVGGATASVLGNDTLNGTAVVPSQITLTPGTAPAPAAGSITMNADGTISIAPGTTAGSYSYPYTICENLNPTNCDSAVATVVVTAPVIAAVDDDFSADPINGFIGGITSTVLTNDTLNGVAFDPAAVVLTPGTAPAPTSGAITMNADGTITVAAGTTAGTYSYDYTICDRVNPTNCATATATVVVAVPVIAAADDDFSATPVNGYAGGATGSVLANDTLNGAQATTANVTLTAGTAPTPAAGSITMNPDGMITVAEGTTAGTYDYPYTICDRVNPTNCATATATVVVAPAVIDAVDSDPTAVSGVNGATLPTVLANDTLNGVPVNPAEITLSPATGPQPTPAFGSITMNPDGTITVAPKTTAGTYTYTYTICENLNPTNCDSATATIIVDEATIDAVDNAPPAINGSTGATTPSVLGNDTLNGAAVIPGDVVLTPGTTPADGFILMNADGTITVEPGTAAGTYIYEYTICEVINPENCDTARATIIVTPPVIDAVDDDYTAAPVNGADGGATPSVLGNDTLNGVDVVATEITLTAGAAPAPLLGSITMTATGIITIAPGTTAGTYSYPYTICEIVNPANCDTATATIVVAAAAIDAVDDDYTATPVNGVEGGATPSVLINDTLNGAAVDPAEVRLTPGTAPAVARGSITMNDDGTITVAAGTTAGTYSYPYTICEILNPANCDTATATIVVAAAEIDAVDDDYTATPLNGADGGETTSVLINDTLNGAVVDAADVALTPGTAPSPAAGAITMGTDGTITVAAGTTAGTYSYPYTICEALNPANCDTATATILVLAAEIDALDDTPVALSGYIGGSTLSVLGNDTLNGDPVTPAAITLTPGTAPAPDAGSITMNPDGTITVAAGTTAGTYLYPYEICEFLNPDNCDTARATVIVAPPAIDAVDDAPAVLRGSDGGTTPSVRLNDSLNGVAVNPAEITLTPGTAPAPAAGSITMNTDGAITVAAGTTAGIYFYPYTICEILNPDNCDTAIATVVVDAPAIDAEDDGPTQVNGFNGATVVSVLGNDTLDGVAVDPALITLTPGAAPAPLDGSITMNPDGTITVAAGTTAGTYVYEYTICEILNPENCDTAVATIILAYSAISLEKTATVETGDDDVAGIGDIISYAFRVTNTGSVPLTDVTIDDPLVPASGGPIASLAAGASDSTTFTATHVLTQDDLDAGRFENSATASGTDPEGLVVSDVSDDPSDSTNGDPDGDGNPDDPTVTLLPQLAVIELIKTDEMDLGEDGLADLGEVITYAFTVRNTGNVTVTDVVVTDPLVDGVQGGPIPILAPGAADSTTFTATYRLTQADLDAGRFENSATATGTTPLGGSVIDTSDDPEGTPGDDDEPTVSAFRIAAPRLDASKSVSNRNPILGEVVTYTLVFENNAAVEATAVRLVDDLPDEVQFVPGSAEVNGAAVEPEQEGNRLVWSPVTIAAGTRATVTFEATVTTLEAGEPAVNETWAEDTDGRRISNIAEAELSRRAEHVFDCTDVIGKVFDDLDGDGYQDEGEPGMPGARVVTLSGQLITVDEHGRFNVPCAALPPDTGENISLKLDTRSLPTGYRVTTENPRVVRGTAGKMVRVNFGVSIGKVSDVDLMDAAFAAGSAEMTRPLHDGLAQLVEMLRDKPGVLRLSYYQQGEDRRLIDARLDAVESRLRGLWQDRGRYKLIIERSVKRIQ